MGFIKTISELLESIFKRSSPEVQKKQQMKKLEQEIREFQPSICRNGMLLPNFGEAIFALYKNTRPLDNLFSVTVSPNNIQRQRRFEAQLIVTGYPAEDQEILDSLSFERRKSDVLAEAQNPDRVYMHQRKELERLVKALNTDGFKKMDSDLLQLRQLVEFCHYNYTPFLQAFDTNFIPADLMYKPSYREISLSTAQNLLEDLYFQSSGLQITTSTADAISALAQLRSGNELTETEQQAYLGNLKKINYIVTKILSPEKLKALIRLCRQDLSYEPDVAKYTGSPRQDFANMLQARFDSDEQRIKTEIQDETISDEVSALFPEITLEEVGVYNQTYNNLLQSEVSMSFKWILPMRILKTFLRHYMPEGAKALLNDIVIEGFFNNPAYKSSFSSIVFAAINADKDIVEFEESFGADKKHSIAVLESYIKDSKKDKDFFKKLEKMVQSINDDAHKVLQAECTNLSSLSRQLGELLADAKKPSSEIISNLKVLMMSSRNRDNTNFLEANYEKWNIFFEIMKNYVIINSGDIKHE
jgi:hypothetical protein